jgi:hypothetical protein
VYRPCIKLQAWSQNDPHLRVTFQIAFIIKALSFPRASTRAYMYMLLVRE